MCAMIPMLRVLASWAPVAIAVTPLRSGPCAVSGGRPGRPRAAVAGGPTSPAVVREGLVGLGHLVGVLAALDRGTQTVAGVQQLVHEALGHRLLPTGPAVLDQPAQAEGGAAGGTDLHRHLVGRPTDAAAADPEGRLYVFPRPPERGGGGGGGLCPGAPRG